MCGMSQNRRFEERYPNGRFLIRKQPLRMVPINGRFWPNPAVGARVSRMTQMGQTRTIAVGSLARQQGVRD